MHLIWENVVKNLMQLWTGQYKDLGAGTEAYELAPTVWEAIGEASASSGRTIPGIFGPRPPNVASDKMSWTADTRSFWFQYVGPVLLSRRFVRPKYYKHFVELVRLVRMCLQYELTTAEIAEIRCGFITWVKDYEQIYYQHDLDRLSACPLTIHALLHIADSIEACGPVWAYWAFPMERYCGSIQPAILNRRFPYSCINCYLVDRSRLMHIKVIYNLNEQLRMAPPHSPTGVSISGYDSCMLLPPCRTITLERGLKDKIISCLCTRFGLPLQELRKMIPSEVQHWGKLRINNDGDTMHASSMSAGAEDGRDATYVRYELLVDRNARFRNLPVNLGPRTFYGQLKNILTFHVASIPAGLSEDLLLGVIQRCNIDESEPGLDVHYYERMGAVEVVDITTVQCVVGRIHDRGRWAVIDRSGSLSRALFTGLEFEG
ncbi:hypothetical protein C8Q77DRAFT_1055307 [Trametes polyzona]|nr:hypothetical protein C8Q77DRAFT_1055307 [Trametes polyzona]